ncbi:MAG TPA: cupin domain-containing protein [Acidimicrobiia bacterium]|nr:cupin domain-containing protein [Acidimicrobiia bacterium]
MDHTASHEIEWAPGLLDHVHGKVVFGPMLLAETPEALTVIGVTFGAGAYLDWHRHPAGQLLYVVDGTAVVQTEDGEAVLAGAGDVVFAPAGEVHWHGATGNAAMTHLSMTDGGPTEWVGRTVTEEEYHSALP